MTDNLKLTPVKDGTTNVALDTELLEVAAGLTLVGSDNTVDPTSEEFAVGFDITKESDLIFSEENGFTPIEGEIEHTGTITFSTAVGHITVGDFTIGFDAARQTENASGFFVQNTVDGAVAEGTILFDIGNPENVEANREKLNLENADLLVSSEFADVLLATGLATDDLTGADVGDAAINAVTENNLAIVQDGTTSVTLNTELLATAAGLTLAGSDSTVEAASAEFAVGFDITKESDLIFSEENGFTPIEGEIEHTGTITFSTAVGHITVGDFTIGFDAARQTENASGFFVQNTVDGAVAAGTILFDVGNPSSLETNTDGLDIGKANLLVSSEFAEVLLATGLATDDLTGADVGDAAINATTDDLTEENKAIVQDGTTSVALDTELLEAAAGLTLAGSDSTVEPISDRFVVGFDITEASDFVFSDDDGFTPIEGEIEHTGTITFSTAVGHITVGDFTIGFDAARQTENASGFFVANTVDGAVAAGTILFDVGNPSSLETDTDGLDIGKANLLVSSEFAEVLLVTGLATDDLTGADVGDAAINATTDDLETKAVVQDGTTSVALDTKLLEAAAGLTLVSSNNTVDPASEEFAVGFDITTESDFIFSDQNGFTPIEGEIEHTGTVTFRTGAGHITVGDFTIGFDAARQTENASGFFVANTVDGVVADGTILFDVSNPGNVEAGESVLNVEDADLLVSSEFADVLLTTGLATDDLTGADVGDVAVNAIVDPISEMSMELTEI